MLAPGTQVFYDYTIPILNERHYGYGYVLNSEVIIGTDPGYAIAIAHSKNHDVAYVRESCVQECN